MKGIQPEFLDNCLPKNDLRSIAQSGGRLISAIGAILSDFRARFFSRLSET
jgi:hypothetical protein